MLVYVFETNNGVSILDVGWNTDEAFATLKQGLETLGASIEAIEAIVVTHIHPDHYGLAGRVREVSGAKVALHPMDAKLTRSRYLDPKELLEQMREFLIDAGAPKDSLEELQNASLPALDRRSFVEPDVDLVDGELAPIPGRKLKVIWTPGHSPGHVCLYEERFRRLYSGDHILPHITANISFHPQSGENPLQEYLSSLEKVRSLDVENVEPAHEYPFTNMNGRIKEIEDHHLERLREIRKSLRTNGAQSAWEVAQSLTWSKPFSTYAAFMKRMAVGETISHLIYLHSKQEVVASGRHPTIYSLRQR
ncbi:Glyoxylase, beta-lactamase superfamily II [Ferrithrix thermotolerans DSM 19514]|uniref:Glyoxylase, beta-lactamase superfamily II n=1 Tax=Ferrithrix thermotolerans DSM 19514 TaxID=1121881 RepID=A0A1M4W307_9ACTN|nr:MBL fold metallo-hydrolase [Ferrithrix thermotolerans]SHE75535.1 Glyoxylase, beta-lactamase superfamily II [Ferrithrix thermotolerans DSM 19514]